MAGRRRSYLGARLTPDGQIGPVREPAEAGTKPDPHTDSDPALIEAIRAEIDVAGGRITFARFMELALYHPERGYYTTSADRPTRSGDFLTAPEVDPMFGRLVARQLHEMWHRLGVPDPFVVREHGAGRGVLGAAILDRPGGRSDPTSWTRSATSRSTSAGGRRSRGRASARLASNGRSATGRFPPS